MKKLGILVGIGISLYAISACALFLASGSWRYRMTVTVETPEGIKTGSAVREISMTQSPDQTPEMTAHSEVKGEAVVVDLGKRGQLFALLRSEMDADHAESVVTHMFPIPGKGIGGAGTPEGIKYYSQLKDAKATLPENELPMLVRFKDINDPKSVERVDPKSLSASFGQQVNLRSIEIEMTEDKVTDGIETWLPWLKALKGSYLHGGRTSREAPLGLYGANFKSTE